MEVDGFVPFWDAIKIAYFSKESNSAIIRVDILRIVMFIVDV
jgi:hypothetical protein